MGFKLTIEELLNGFAAGFVLLFGLAITNYRMALNEFNLFLQNGEFNLSDSILIIIAVYIVGLALSAVTNFLEQDFYLFFDGLVRKTYRNPVKGKSDKIINLLINKPLFFILRITLYLFFRRWSTVETFILLSKKFKELEQNEKKLADEFNEMQKNIENELSEENKERLMKLLMRIEVKKEKAEKKYKDYCARHEGLKFVAGKTSEILYTMDKKFEGDEKEKKVYGRYYWHKSQFWQMCGNAILFIFLINIFVFHSITFISVGTIIYIITFFLSKYMSPMYMKMQLRQIYRDYKARNGNEPF